MFVASASRLKKFALVALVLGGAASSTIGFEGVQFLLGYPHYERAYIPQKLSKVADDVTPEEYREVCAAISTSNTSSTRVISGDFAFRYYCKADMYATLEEGAAYLQLSRNDLVAWHAALLAQRAALNSRNAETIRSFSESVGASVVILPREAELSNSQDSFERIIQTKKHFLYFIDNE